MIQRIEIVWEPIGAIYGSDAIGGVINIITKKTPDKASGGVITRYKSHLDKDSDGGMGSVWVGSKLGKTSFILSGSTQSIGGWNDDGDNPDDGDDNQTAQDGDLLVRAYRSKHENKMQFSPTAPVTSEEDAERWLNQVEARYTVPIVGNHLVSVGAEFRQEGREDSTGADNDLDNTSIVIQDELEIFSSLYVTAGLRYDDHSEFGDQFSPKASLVYGIYMKHPVEDTRKNAEQSL